MATANANISSAGLARPGLLKKGPLFLLFLVLEAAVFAILPLSAIVSIHTLVNVQVAVVVILLVAALLLRSRDGGGAYWPVCYALFVAGLAVLVSTLFQGDLISLLGFSPSSLHGHPPAVAAAKLSESTLRVFVILVLMAIGGAGWPSMYLQKGRLGLGLAVGFAGFIVLAAVAFLPAMGQPGGVSRLVSLLPWIVLFVISNAFMEELLYRGILLKRYEALLGKGVANLLAAVVFTAVHFQAGYVADVVQFLVVLFPLALIWGWLMQKTDSLWGSVIFHAGADCVIIFGIFASV